jgi:hypothetical protein
MNTFYVPLSKWEQEENKRRRRRNILVALVTVAVLDLVLFVVVAGIKLGF